MHIVKVNVFKARRPGYQNPNHMNASATAELSPGDDPAEAFKLCEAAVDRQLGIVTDSKAELAKGVRRYCTCSHQW